MSTQPSIETELARRAGALARAGYGPLPLPHRQKAAPPPGFTGAAEVNSYADWHAVVEEQPLYWRNLGARLPLGAVGIDVDAYGPKREPALASLAALGDLPPTVVVGARLLDADAVGSGIRLYRLPEDFDQAWLGTGLGGIDVIRFGHRYLVAPGSDHPTGRVYSGVDERTGEAVLDLPDVAGLPLLPLAVARALAATERPRPAGHGRPRETLGVLAPTSAPASAPQGQEDPTGGSGGPMAAEYARRAGEQPCAGMLRAIARMEEQTTDPQGHSRHDLATGSVWRMANLAAEGHFGFDAAVSLAGLVFTGHVSADRAGGQRETTDEWDRIVATALAKVEARPSLPPICECDIAPVEEWASTQRPAGLFDHPHPLIAWCVLAARANMASREAVLGAALVAVSAEISPFVLVDSPLKPTTLNTYAFLVGPSGSGKTHAHDLVHDAHAWTSYQGTPGSGEGIARVFVERQTVEDETGRKEQRAVRVRWRWSAWIDEYGQLASTKQRSGSTITAILRKAWGAARLGEENRADETRLPVEAGTYRLSICAGIQPGLVHDVFKGSDLGDPQRWLWFKATDPSISLPDGLDTPDLDDYLALPEWATRDHLPMSQQTSTTKHGLNVHVLPIPQSVRDVIEAEREQRARSEVEIDDAHMTLVRLRLSGVLALADGRVEVSEEDWRLAGGICAVSSRNRRALLGVADDKRKAAKVAAARLDATVADVVEADRVEEVARTLARRVATKGSMLKREVLRGLTPTKRPHAVPALELAVERGWLLQVESETGGATGAQHKTTYEIGPSWVP
jgi:hypothetical protein